MNGEYDSDGEHGFPLHEVKLIGGNEKSPHGDSLDVRDHHFKLRSSFFSSSREEDRSPSGGSLVSSVGVYSSKNNHRGG